MDYWPRFENTIAPHLSKDDDPLLWSTAIGHIFQEATFLARCVRGSPLIQAQIGCCSHWLRPHQSRWTAAGGFAWPSGYGGSGYSRLGPPEHDWAGQFFWNPWEELWVPDKPEISSCDQLTFRVTIPARTSRHRQAAVPANWTEGSPVLPQKKLFQIYGFRKQSSGWRCTATTATGATHYDLAAEHPANKLHVENES